MSDIERKYMEEEGILRILPRSMPGISLLEDAGLGGGKLPKIDRTQKITPAITNQIKQAYSQGYTTPSTIRSQINNILSLTQISRLMKNYGLKSKKIITQPSLVYPRRGKVKGVVFPNKLMEQNYIKDLQSRGKFSQRDKNWITDAVFKSKYYDSKTSLSKIEKVNSFLKNKYNIQTPLKYGDEALRVRTLSKLRNENLKKISDPKYEKKIRGDKQIHLHHMDSKSINTTSKNLGYAPGTKNVGVIKDAEYKITALYNQREKILSTKPSKDREKKLEEINVKGMNVVSDPKVSGFLNFKIVNPLNLKTSDFGIKPGYTIGQGIINKPIKKLSKTDKEIIALNKQAIMDQFKNILTELSCIR
jgi:hypothetical protein